MIRTLRVLRSKRCISKKASSTNEPQWRNVVSLCALRRSCLTNQLRQLCRSKRDIVFCVKHQPITIKLKHKRRIERRLVKHELDVESVIRGPSPTSCDERMSRDTQEVSEAVSKIVKVLTPRSHSDRRLTQSSSR